MGLQHNIVNGHTALPDPYIRGTMLGTKHFALLKIAAAAYQSAQSAADDMTKATNSLSSELTFLANYLTFYIEYSNNTQRNCLSNDSEGSHRHSTISQNS